MTDDSRLTERLLERIAQPWYAAPVRFCIYCGAILALVGGVGYLHYRGWLSPEIIGQALDVARTTLEEM